jgi:hypothetical protein
VGVGVDVGVDMGGSPAAPAAAAAARPLIYTREAPELRQRVACARYEVYGCMYVYVYMYICLYVTPPPTPSYWLY